MLLSVSVSRLERLSDILNLYYQCTNDKKTKSLTFQEKLQRNLFMINAADADELGKGNKDRIEYFLFWIKLYKFTPFSVEISSKMWF